ncbi:MAG: bifunctional lysine ketoglutarate reductase /saccharopine dehydrogenase family protein [Bacteroidales bacterium]
MSNFIGIRHEDKYVMERRAPLTPKHVKRLIEHQKLDFIVQTSQKRIFTDQEYIDAGALVENDLKKCNVILGVKEMPLDFFEPNKTYVFFSHTIKGQSYNLPMLKRMMELGCNLIDYERIVDEQNKRLIFFGKYAGLAGMINSFWALGLRIKHLGYDTPFLQIKQAHHYNSLKEAKDAVSLVGQIIAEKGLPKEIQPLVIGFTGYGNVSMGAQEICGLLPVKEISTEKLLDLKNRKDLPNNIIFKVVFKEKHISEHIDKNVEFDLYDYYRNPQKYVSKFEQYIPHLTVLMNCMFWDARYPRIITKDYLEKLYSAGNPKLTVIGDITCDANGSIECTNHGTEIEDPIFIYNPLSRTYTMGYQGEGILDMAVDILPSELPRDASDGFADALANFIKPIVFADYDLPFEDLDLPKSLKKALILHKGKFTHEFEYLNEYLAL